MEHSLTVDKAYATLGMKKTKPDFSTMTDTLLKKLINVDNKVAKEMGAENYVSMLKNSMVMVLEDQMGRAEAQGAKSAAMSLLEKEKSSVKKINSETTTVDLSGGVKKVKIEKSKKAPSKIVSPTKGRVKIQA